MTDLGLPVFRDAISTALIIVYRKRYDALFMNFTSERILKKAIVAYFKIRFRRYTGRMVNINTIQEKEQQRSNLNGGISGRKETQTSFKIRIDEVMKTSIFSYITPCNLLKTDGVSEKKSPPLSRSKNKPRKTPV